jgi:hypothetical protein
MTPGVHQRPQPHRRRGHSFELDQCLTEPGHRFAELGGLVGGPGLGHRSLRRSGVVLAPAVLAQGLRQRALLPAPLTLLEATVGFGERLVDLDQLFHAKLVVLDLLDVPDRLVERTHRAVVVSGAQLGPPTIESRALLEIGARHRVLHELDARKISRDLLHRGAPAAQQTDESEAGQRAAGAHCSMNRPLLKS